MTCAACKTDSLKEGSTTYTVERGDMILVVRHVPALVCAQCGEEYVAAEAHERLEVLVAQAQREGVQFAVREFGDPVSVN